MQANIIRCLSQARISWEAEIAAERALDVKMGEYGGGSVDSLDGMASRWIVGASASVIFPSTIKSRRWRTIMEEVDNICSKYCM